MSLISKNIDVFSAWEEGDGMAFKQLTDEFTQWMAELKRDMDSGLSTDEFKRVQGLYAAVSAAKDLCFKRQ